MIPDFIKPANCIWDVLPPGIHMATLHEVEHRFAVNPKRVLLFSGLVRGISNLKKAGCKMLYLDGSYVTAKPNPGDYDACWEPAYVDASLLDPVFLDFTNRRAAQKQKYYGEYFISIAQADATGRTFLDFFQIEKDSGEAKGIIGINLDAI